MIDLSCFVGTGPLVPPTLSTPDAVESLLRAEGVRGAAVSPLAGLFDADPAVNDELWDLPPFFRPVPIADPRWAAVTARLATWRDRGCRAVRIVPGSHGYRASEAAAVRAACGSLGLVLVVQLRVADPRNLPKDLHLGQVDPAEVITLARSAPPAPMVVAGARVPELSAILPATPDSVLADVSLAEEPDVLRRAVAAHGARRLVIGTHTPFLTPAAARHKLTAARLPPADRHLVATGNAENLGF